MAVAEHAARAALVITADDAIGRQLADGLGGDGPTPRAVVTGAARGDEIRSMIDRELAAGPPALVVVSLVPDDLTAPAAIDSLDLARWRDLTETPVLALFHVLQALQAGLAGSEAAVAVVGPTVGHVGAPGLSALCTVLEAQRGMVKSVARQWGELGLTISWIGVAGPAWNAALAAADLAEGPEFGPPHRALGRAPALGEAARAAGLLATPEGRLITGGTFNIDGGEWMLP